MAMTVTVTQTAATANGMGLTVLVLTGAKPVAAQTGAVKSADTNVSPAYSQPLIITATGSMVYGALSDGVDSTAYVAAANTTLLENFSDTTNICSYATFRSTAATAATGSTSYGATKGTSGGAFAGAEILAATTIAQDASTPSPASSGTSSALFLTCASFTPVGGSLIVVMAGSDASGSGTPALTITNTGGLAFTRLAFFGPASNPGSAAVWIADVPGGAAVLSAPPLLIPPGYQSPAAFWPFSALQASPGPLAVSDGDTGTGADTAVIAAAAADGDTGAGADTATAAAAVAGADAGTGTDTASAAAAVSDGDTGTGADTAGVAVAVSDGDTGAGTDTASAAIPAAPPGPQPAMPPGFISPAAFWPFQAQPGPPPVVAVSGSDTGTGTDTAAAAAALPDGDTASGADTASVAVAVSAADTAAGTDTASASAALSGGDTGTGADTATVTITGAAAAPPGLLIPPGFISPAAFWRFRAAQPSPPPGSAPAEPFLGRAQILIAWASDPFSPSPAWTDVTDWIRLDHGITMDMRGRQDNISETNAGRLELTGDNSNGEFTVGLSSSPWSPKIGRRIQVNIPDESGVLHTRYDGLITELPTSWEGGPGIESLEQISASDIQAWLARQPALLSWTQQEMLADAPVALYSLADTTSVTSASDQAGQGAQPLQVVSQGDGSGQAQPGSGVPLTEVITSNITAQLQKTETFTFTTAGPIEWTAPSGTILQCDVTVVAGGQGGQTVTLAHGSNGGHGGELAREMNLAITAGQTYPGTVGGPGTPGSGLGGDTSFTGDAVTVLAHGSGSGSTNSIHRPPGSGAVNNGGAGGGGGSSGGQYQDGNKGVVGGAGGNAPTGGGEGGAGDQAGGGGQPGAQPGGGGGGAFFASLTGSTSPGAGGAGQITIVVTYIPPPDSQQNSTLSAWLFTPSGTLAARILSGPLPQPVTAAAGFAAECWASFVSFPAQSVTTYTNPGAITPWPCPPGVITQDTVCVAGGQAGANATTGNGGTGGDGAELAEEPQLAVTPGLSYPGTVGAAGTPSAGLGGDTSFTGDAVTVLAHATGTGSSNTVHHDGGQGGVKNGGAGGGGASSGGQFQDGNGGGSVGGAGGVAPFGGGAGGAGDQAGAGGTPGSQPGGGGGAGHYDSINGTSAGGAGGVGQITVTCQPSVSALLTLTSPRGRSALAVWVTAAGHLQLASTSGYGTRNPAWTTVDAGTAPVATPFHVAVSVTAGVATLYVDGVSQGTLALPAGASYTWLSVGGSYAGWLGGWNGSAGLAAVYPAPLSAARVGVHFTAGNTGFAGSSTGTMIARIASYTGLPAAYYTPPSGPSDPSYGLSTVSYADLKGQGPLAAMQTYEQAEAGLLYVSAAGRLVFADRATRYAAGSAGQPAFVLQAGQYEADLTSKSNDQYLCTAACFATINLPGGFPVSSTAGLADFGNYGDSGTVQSPSAGVFADATAAADSYSADDLMDAGWWAVNVLGQPVPRVPSITVDLLTLPASEFSIAAFYAADIGGAVQLAGLPAQAPDAAGQALAGYEVIEGVTETISLDEHTVALYTSPLAQNAAWIPGDSLLGVLGTTTTAGRSRTPSALGPPYTPVPAFGPTLNRTGAVGAQDLRTLTVNVQDRLTPPLLTAQQANAQVITTLAGQPVTFDTIAADTAGGMAAITTYTIQDGYPGWYWCAAVVQAATGTASLGGIAAWFAATLGGVASQWHARVIPYLSTAPYTAVAIAGRIGPCAAGDTIQVIAAAAGSPASMPLGTADGGSVFTLIWQGD